MSERLIVKNFGPIKEADFKLKKVNFFIGEQGTGKSTLAKLIAIFKDLNFILDNTSKGFFQDFNLKDYFKKNSFLKFEGEDYSIEYKNNRFHKTFINELKFLHLDYQKNRISRSKSKSQAIFIKNRIIHNSIFKKIGGYTYIPAERILLSIISNSIYNFYEKKIKLPEYILAFGQEYVDSKSDVNKAKYDWLNLKFSFEKEIDFISVNKQKKIELKNSASGFQSILPMLLVVDSQTQSDDLKGIFLIEEPELNLSPITQNKLTKYLIESCLKFNDNILITTHSPYILATINNLVYSFKIGNVKPKKVAKIIAKKLWLNPDELNAYRINKNGAFENLVDDELKLIKVEKIDEISEEINKEYQLLADIEYEK